MCKEKQIVYDKSIRTSRLHLPKIPMDEWCDFRLDYESGMNLKMIAEKYMCDPRTVKRCLFTNKSSDNLGKQTEPTKIAAFADAVNSLYKEYVSESRRADTGCIRICDISRKITAELQSCGYTGTERTVRNYLRAHYRFADDEKNGDSTK